MSEAGRASPFGAAHAAFVTAARARRPFLAPPCPAAVAAVATAAPAWLDALTTLLAAGRMTPRAYVHRRDRAAGHEAREQGDATDYVALLGTGRERWTLHGTPDHVHELHAGSAVYIPAGLGVTVETVEPARLWYFTFAFPSWLDVVANTAMLELGAARAWREPGSFADEDAAVMAALAALRALHVPREDPHE